MLFGIVLSTFGMLTFLSGFFLTYFNVAFEKELPLNNLNGIVVDLEQNIHVGLGYYGRIQTYNKDGVFIKNWHVHAGAGDFKMALIGSEIIVFTARGNKKLVFNSKGDAISENTYNDNYSAKGNKSRV